MKDKNIKTRSHREYQHELVLNREQKGKHTQVHVGMNRHSNGSRLALGLSAYIRYIVPLLDGLLLLLCHSTPSSGRRKFTCQAHVIYGSQRMSVSHAVKHSVADGLSVRLSASAKDRNQYCPNPTMKKICKESPLIGIDRVLRVNHAYSVFGQAQSLCHN